MSSDFLDKFSKDVGGYWEKDNNEFEKTNPAFIERVGRSLNPITGLGSALGSLYTAAGEGDGVGAALAAFGAVPAFGVMRAPVQGLAPGGKAIIAKTIINNKKGIRNVAAAGTTDAGVDKYQAASAKQGPKVRAYEPSRDLVDVPDHLRGIQQGPEIPLDSALQFEQRVLYPSRYPVLETPEEGLATHKMAWGDVNLRKGEPPVSVAFPTVVYDGSTLKALDNRAAFEHAIKTGEFREFADPSQAELYAEGFYKKAWGRGDAVEALRARLRHEGKQ